jgi:predicted ATPase/DNA-binding XRE family transcriptional regulator
MLRYLRRRARLQQRDLAIAVGYSESQISRLEQNQRLPDMAALAALFVPALGLDAEPALAEQLLELAAAARAESPASPAPSTAGYLPVPLTPLIDRAAEVAAASAALARADVRLLTLVGPPGIGKTRLALHLADALGEQFPGGVVFVALAPIRDPALVLPAIAHALGIKRGGARPLIELLRDALLGRRVLLVLDNFEQVLPAAPHVAELLRAAPHTTALVTSRAALHLSGEHLFVVPPLALPAAGAQPDALAASPAVQLFLTRARALDSALPFTAENASAIAALCACLEGVPLAIELAAARGRLFSPPALLERLCDASGAALQVLVDGPRDLPAHQRTLRGTLDWSYELLAAPERAVLMRLAVFAGGCTASAAEAVCGEPGAQPGIAFCLQALVEQSLLRCDAGADRQPRFSMLETIRSYAREKLEKSGELVRAQQRHAAFYTQLAAKAAPALAGAQQEAVLHTLEQEVANLRAAIEWCAEAEPARGLRLLAGLRQFWFLRGYLSEARTWLAALLADERAHAAEAHIRAQALVTAGLLAFHQGDLEAARKHSEAALALSRAAGDTRAEVDALFNLGGVAFYQNDYAAAGTRFIDCLERYRALGALPEMALALKNLGLVAKDQGQYVLAITYFSESLTLAQQLGDRRGVAQGLFNLGVVAYWQSDFAQAYALSEQSAAAYRALGDQMGAAYALDTLGMAAHKLGRRAQAREQLDEGLRLLRALGDQMGVALLLTDLATVAVDGGEWAQARQQFWEAIAVSMQVGDRRRIAFCLEGLARALLPEQCDAAAQLLGAAEALREAIGAPLPPSEQAAYAASVAQARASCGREFASNWARGRAAPLRELLATQERAVGTGLSARW